VCFSGDKLLGGPQAGIAVGRRDLLERLNRHPIARAVRLGRMQIAALEQVLALVAAGREGDVPVYRMLRESSDQVRARAQTLSATIGGELEGARVVKTDAAVGGGSMPGAELPSWGVRIKVAHPEAFASRLRTGTPAAVCRVQEAVVLLDCRTVSDEQIPHLARAVFYALEGDDEHDHDLHGDEVDGERPSEDETVT
jgi:L-seryl-tRNA(Ser) seleniumtransferase